MPTLTLKAYEYLAGLVAIIVICGSLWLAGDWHGHKVVKAQWDAAKAAQIKAVSDATVKSAAVTERVVTQYVDRVQTVVQKGDTITQRIPVYIHDKDDAACPIPAGFGSVLDAAAQGRDLPGSTGPASNASAASAKPSGG